MASRHSEQTGLPVDKKKKTNAKLKFFIQLKILTTIYATRQMEARVGIEPA